MKFSFAILYALKSFRRRKLRAALTIFAVLIGTTLVSSMVSLGVGLQTMVVTALESAGELTDINVYQKDKSEALLDASAISRLENLDGVETVDPLVTLMADSASLSGFSKKAEKILVTAAPANSQDIFKLIAGKPFSAFDGASVVIGENFLKKFSQDNPESFLGKSLNLTFGEKNLFLKIAGVAKSENIWGYGVFIPLSQASAVKTIAAYDSLRVRASSVQKVAGVSKEIKEMGLEAVALDE